LSEIKRDNFFKS